MTTLRDILNRALWKDASDASSAGLHAFAIDVLHRGAPQDHRVIEGRRILAIKAGGIELLAEEEGGDPIFVPYHRFLSITGPDGPIWVKGDGALTPAPEPVAEIAPEVAPEVAKEIATDIEVVLARVGGLLHIDGSAGEGGGQILRTSLALSIATGTPFVLENIRAGRKKPGLARQHLACVNAAALVGGASVEGASLGSTRIEFRPGVITAADHIVDIGSAGSISLVLQTIAFALARASAPSRITLRGGTHASWAPPFPFLAEAWLPLVHRAGAEITLDLRSPGFYPAGGGEVVMTVTPSARWKPLHLADTSVLGPVALVAIVNGLPEAVGDRELDAASELLADPRSTRQIITAKSLGKGNAMWLVARDEACGLVNVFSAIGEVGVRAEDVGRSVANDFLAWRDTGTSVEPHLADQVMLPIALAGAGSFTTSELTLHARTNIEVIRAFTGHRLRAWALEPNRIRVSLTP